MARLLRIDRAGLWQHVTARGNERRGGLKWGQLGQVAGGMEDAAAGMAVRRFAERLRTDQALARLVQKAEKELANVANWFC